MSSPGSTRPSTRPGGKDIRDVIAAFTAQAREEHKTPQQQAPPDMQTGQSIRACLRREVPADHEAHSQPQRRQLRRVATTELRRECTPETEARKAKPWQRTTIAPHAGAQREQTRAKWRSMTDDPRHKAGRGRRTTVDDRGEQSRAKPDERRSVHQEQKNVCTCHPCVDVVTSCVVFPCCTHNSPIT